MTGVRRPRPLRAASREKESHKRRVRLRRIGRDTAVLTFALTAAGFEILVGGGRPSVLTFLGALIASPFVFHVDDYRRDNQGRRR